MNSTRNRAKVVIGSGYGDEGKGLATDFHARNSARPLVIRFNGGAQAGHTVVDDAGRRHVFSHFGSGSLAGAPTWLSRFFVCHPMLFFSELDALQALGLNPTVYVDPACPVTTPFDIMLNQAVESARGTARHGSCGLGFGETLERQLYPEFRLYAADLARPGRTQDKLRAIRDRYLPYRLHQLGITTLPTFAHDDAIIERYLDDGLEFSRLTHRRDADILRDPFDLIFEGAQGLLLDMDRGAFPYVTRSNTGLKNVVELAHEAGLEALAVSYISRCYATRHGAGPLAHELDRPPLAGHVDRTNVRNAWQGSLRHAWLDVDRISAAVRADLGDATGMDVRHEWLLTWMDQTDQSLRYIADGRLVSADGASLAAALAARSGAAGVRISSGETATAVSARSTLGGGVTTRPGSADILPARPGRSWSARRPQLHAAR